MYRLVLMSLTLTALSGCLAPRSFKEARRPREGRSHDGRVCIVYSQRYQISLAGLEKLHPFDINKYSKIYLQLVTDGWIAPADVFVPEEIRREDLLRVHSVAYLDERLREPVSLARYLEFGMAEYAPAGLTDAAVLEAFRYTTGGTLKAARLALEYGIAVNLGGGYHHAMPDAGGGFCIYADMPVAIRTLQAERLIERALVVDLDVHQGNGTAVCVANDDRVFTFDMHEEDIYPIPKEVNDLDIPLPAGMSNEEYLAELERHLPAVFDAARPDIVFYQAGVDVLKGDPLANLSLTRKGVVRRDRLVIAECVRRGVPVVMVLGGGYSPNAWRVQYQSIVDLLERYGNAARGHPRQATVHEKVYTK